MKFKFNIINASLSYFVGFGVVPFLGSSTYLSYRLAKSEKDYEYRKLPRNWPVMAGAHCCGDVFGISTLTALWTLMSPITFPYYIATTCGDQVGRNRFKVKIEKCN